MNDREPYPIPVLSIVRDALIIPWHKRATMFRALLPVSVVRIASDLIWHLTPQELSWASTFVSWIVFVLALAVFAITTHRLILLGDGSVPRYGLAKWSSRETRFVRWILMIYLYGYIVTAIALILVFRSMVAGNTGVPYLAIIAFSVFFVYPRVPDSRFCYRQLPLTSDQL